MGIGTALSISLTGLKTNQAQLDLTANNVANAGTPGYSRKRISTEALIAGNRNLGVAPARVQREVDLQVQRQWRTSAAAAEYAAVRSTALGRIDTAIGAPGSANALDTLFSQFKSAFEKLATSPEDVSARIDAAAGAETMANRLRSLSDDVQTLRQEAETSISSAVSEVNELLQHISALDKEIIAGGAGGGGVAGLQDQRDAAIDQLAELVDIRVEEQDYGAVAIHTTSGVLLYDDQAAVLGFDAHGTIGADSLYSSDPAERGVGTLKIVGGPGAGLDLFEGSLLRSGAIAAYRELRDETLVQAQSQLDELAAQLALSVSNRVDEGTAYPTPPVSSGTPAGFDVNLANFKAGNTVTLAYTDGSGSHTVTFVGQNGTDAISKDYTADPSDTVVAVDVSGGASSIASQIQLALGGGFTVTNPSGATLRILDDGTSTDVTSMKASVSTGALKGDTPAGAAFDLFVDSATGQGFTGITGTEPAKPGFASRIVVNPAVKRDPANLVLFDTGTSVSDATRPTWVVDRISQASFRFSPDSGIGTATAPYTGTISGFLNQVVSTQGAAAETAHRVSEGQSVVTKNLEERYGDSRAVDIDEEMARLIELQSAYQANARIIQAVKEMLDTLMNI